MARKPPILRVSLRPFIEHRPDVVPAPRVLIRLGTWGRYPIETGAQPAPEPSGWRLGHPAVLALETPFTIIPFAFRTAGRIACSAPPRGPGASPPPSWRGRPCRWGQTFIAFRNDAVEDPTSPEAWMPFSVLALFPERDPPGPPPAHILLGSEFFILNSRLRISLRFGDVDFEPGTRRPLPFVECGDITA